MIFDRVKLGDLLNDPTAIEDVPVEEVPGLIIGLASVQTALAARMARSPIVKHETAAEQMIRVPAAARLLGVSTSYVYRHKDQLPHTRMGRRILFSARKLERFIERRIRTS